MATPLATLLTIVGAIALLYVLIKVHVRLIRRTWRPLWEEEREEEESSETEEEHRAWDEIR